uniref:SUEL-type lectin domain-containing protein n=1 Tax=Sinocyclocheilus grahami TaxID=75366 RepID=A0A672RBN2_SINGR
VLLLIIIIFIIIIIIYCDTGVISVQSATCGRTSSQICSIGRPPSETSYTQCSIDVTAVFKRCNGLRECELNTQGLAPKDPCFGTYKYYTTNYICIPAETSVTCHGGYSYLKCENGKIQINTANYGRTDKTTCSEGRPSEQLQNTNCYSPNALAPVSKRCNGLRECELNTQGLAPKDPCFGTYKYYTTNYICIPAVLYNFLLCVNIQINTANYGRTDKTTCSEGRPSEQLQNTNCYSPNALAPVSKSCNGLESCEVFATHTVFTDPCFGIYKYLAISYFCLPPGVRE